MSIPESIPESAARAPEGWRPRCGLYVVLDDGREVRQLRLEAPNTPNERYLLDLDPPTWVSIAHSRGLRAVATLARAHGECVELRDLMPTGAVVNVGSQPRWAVDRGGRYDHGEASTTVTVPREDVTEIRERVQDYPSGPYIITPLFERLS